MSAKSIFNINVFTPKPGKAELFAQAQLAGIPGLAEFPGSLGGRLFQAVEAERFVLVSEFESVEAQRRFATFEPFLRHRQNLLPLIEQSSADLYRLIYARP